MSADFNFTEITLLRNRYEGQDSEPSGQYNLLQAVLEFNIFESLDVPYLTGNVVINDSSALGSELNFQGQERLRIVWEVDGVSHDKTFIVYAMSAQVKGMSDQVSTYVLELIEEHGFLSYFKRLKGYRSGNIADIISNLFVSELDIDEADLVLSPPAQTVQVLDNNRTPLGIAHWLVQRATNDVGEPMFLYSTLNGGIRLRGLSEMAADFPLADQTFALTQPSAPFAQTEIISRQRILGVTFHDNDDMIEAARTGALRSTYFSIDPFKRTVQTTEFDAITHFENRKEVGSTLYPYSQFDENFTVQGKNIREFSSVYCSRIDTSGGFGEFKSYAEEIEADGNRAKISRESDTELLYRESFEITVNGHLFGSTEEHRTVGTVINIFIPKDQPSYQSGNDTADLRRSGKFLIMKSRHKFILEGDYHITHHIGRLGIPDDINDPNRDIRRPQ